MDLSHCVSVPVCVCLVAAANEVGWENGECISPVVNGTQPVVCSAEVCNINQQISQLSSPSLLSVRYCLPPNTNQPSLQHSRSDRHHRHTHTHTHKSCAHSSRGHCCKIGCSFYNQIWSFIARYWVIYWFSAKLPKLRAKKRNVLTWHPKEGKRGHQREKGRQKQALQYSFWCTCLESCDSVGFV